MSPLAQFLSGLCLSVLSSLVLTSSVSAAYHFSNYQGRPPIHVYGSAKTKPTGLSPDQIKKTYRLPSSGGSGTVAIIAAYDNPTIENDL
jgi:hypothetical protein